MVEFRDPPPVEQNSTALPEPTWAKVVADRPHAWAMVETFPTHGGKTAVNHRQHWIATGRYAWQRSYAGHWEATYRDAGTVFELFVRFMPGRRGR